MTTMAMFPLGSPLFPGGALPLQVFEPRYRAMMKHCLQHEPVFGVALITRGREVGGGDQRSMVATAARIEQIAEWPDGRYSLLAVGFRRLRIQRWLPDDPFPWAEVSDWPESSEPVAAGLVTEVETKLAALHAKRSISGCKCPRSRRLTLPRISSLGRIWWQRFRHSTATISNECCAPMGRRNVGPCLANCWRNRRKSCGSGVGERRPRSTSW